MNRRTLTWCLAAAWCVTEALSARQGQSVATNRTTAAIEQAAGAVAARETRLARWLALSGQLQAMRVALGEVDPNTAGRLVSELATQLIDGNDQQIGQAVLSEHQRLARRYFEGIEQSLAGGATWPADQSSAVYTELARSAIAGARARYAAAVAGGSDPIDALREANLVLAWSRGRTAITPDLDLFLNLDQAVENLTPRMDATTFQVPPHPGLAPRTLAVPAPRTSGAAGPQDALSETRLREVAVWRAAFLQLEVAVGRRTQTSRADALAQAVALWRAQPATINVQAEIAALTPLAEAYLSMTWEANAARWPSGESPAVYARMAKWEMSEARIDFVYATAATSSPGPALARAARVYGWTQGRKDMPTAFDDLDADVAVAMAQPPVPPPWRGDAGNLALNKPARQSSARYPGSQGGVDGVKNEQLGFNDPLGAQWHVEENGLLGVWTRRPGGNTFDAVWPSVGVRAVLEMTLVGIRVTIARRQSSDGNDCDYIGTFVPPPPDSGPEVTGTYTCTRFPNPMPWRATVSVTQTATPSVTPPVRSTSWGSPINLALKKPARQSSRSMWSRPDDPQGAVDGVKNGSFGFCTEREANPWWDVDLGAEYLLDRVIVYNRLDFGADVAHRATPIEVWVSHDGVDFRRVVWNRSGPFGGVTGKPLELAISGTRARFVRLRLNSTDYLHLDEVEVLGWTSTVAQGGRTPRAALQ